MGRIYTKEMISFLQKNRQNNSIEKLKDAFNLQFGTNKSHNAIKCACIVYNIIVKNRKKASSPTVYTKKMIDFLQEHAENSTNEELTTLFNRHFGLQKSITAVRNICSKYGVSKPRFIYSEEMMKFLKEKVNLVEINELTNEFNRRFSTHKSVDVIKNICINLQGESHNHPIGKETMSSDGRVLVKTKNGWKYKHRIIWEKYNKPLNRDEFIIFADGNKNNMSEENLIKVTMEEHSILNNLRLKFDNAELTKTGVTIAKIHEKISKITSNKK